MPILYSAVARENRLIANFASCEGNFKEIVELLLSKVPSGDKKMTYEHGRYLFHYIAKGQYLYICITDKTCQRSRSFLFLNEIKRRFSKDSVAFEHTLAEEMYRYSEDYNTIVVREGELDEINSIGVGCSDSLLGEKCLYVHNPENLTFSTISYVGETPQKISISVQHQKLYILIISVMILGLAVFILGTTPSAIISGIIILLFFHSYVKT